MIHRHRPCFAAAIIIIAASLNAQVPATTMTADRRFQEVLVLTQVAPLSKSKGEQPKTRDELKGEVQQQALRARQASESARLFYTLFPDHPKATEARRIEALSAVRAVQAGDSEQERSALALAKAFRTNAAFSKEDRFEVALAMERLDLSLRVKAQRAQGRSFDWVRLGHDLRMEFGEVPALYSYYMEVAVQTDKPEAIRLAQLTLRSAVAPLAAKARAQTVLDAAALVGQPLNLRLSKVGGGEIAIGGASARVRAIIAWSPSDSTSLQAVEPFLRALPTGSEVVYLAIGGTAQALARLTTAQVSGRTYCHASAGAPSRAATDALKLQYSPLPRAYVIDQAGILIGCGQPQDIPKIFAVAAR